jgi:hypothetical protein
MNTTENDYAMLQAELGNIEAKTGLYLADPSVDRENVMCSEDAPEFWGCMYAAACAAAGFRAEEHGQNINELIGTCIY